MHEPPGPILPKPKTDLRERLGLFAMGAAIGCVLVGLIFTNRAREKAAREAANPSPLGQPVQPTPAP